MPARSRPDGARTLRTKTFTGCWTCRARHVKCDEGRPSCHRCRKAHIICKGYGVRLSWARAESKSYQRATQRDGTSSQQGQSELRSQRRSSSQTQSADSITKQISDQPRASSSFVSNSLGTTALSTNDFGQSSWQVAQKPAEPRPELDFSPTSLLAQARFVFGEEGFEQNLSPANSCPLTSVGSLSLESGDGSDAQENIPSSITLLNGPVTARIDDLAGNTTSAYGNSTAYLGLRQLEALPDLPFQRQLLEHWACHLADAMMPIPHFKNPLRSVITPIALDGAQNSTNASSPATAVFHFICSASAYHLARTERQESMMGICLSHHETGMKHLRHALSNANRGLFVPLLAAFCMCLFNETLSVGMPFWRVHVQGVCAWMKHIEASIWSESASASALYQLVFGLVTMIQLQLVTERDTDAESPRLDFKVPEDDFCMDVMFGLRRPTLTVLLEILDMKHSQVRYESVTSAQLDTLEMKIYLSSPPSLETLDSPEIWSVIHHHCHLFHCAAIVYYKRCLRRASLTEVRPWVCTAVEHLEKLLQCCKKPCSISVWPTAIIAFETNDTSIQNRVECALDELFRQMKFDVWRNLKELAMDLWSKRNNCPSGEDQDDLAWEHYFRQQGQSPLLLA